MTKATVLMLMQLRNDSGSLFRIVTPPVPIVNHSVEIDTADAPSARDVTLALYALTTACRSFNVRSAFGPQF